MADCIEAGAQTERRIKVSRLAGFIAVNGIFAVSLLVSARLIIKVRCFRRRCKVTLLKQVVQVIPNSSPVLSFIIIRYFSICSPVFAKLLMSSNFSGSNFDLLTGSTSSSSGSSSCGIYSNLVKTLDFRDLRLSNALHSRRIIALLIQSSSSQIFVRMSQASEGIANVVSSTNLIMNFSNTLTFLSMHSCNLSFSFSGSFFLAH